jgi:undecaprenyl-diphosphatase
MADTVGRAEGAERCDPDACAAPIAGARGRSALLKELETPPRRTGIFETATLLTLAVAFLSISLFVWTAETFSNRRIQALDLSIRISIHEHTSNLMTEAMIVFSQLGEPGVAIGATLTIGIFLWLRRYRAALWIVVSLIGAALLNASLKFAFHRPRPLAFFGPQPGDFSFPSGHALVSACFYGTVAGLMADRTRSVHWRVLIWLLSLAMIAGIGVSRIYLGVHYPSDVLAGYLAAAGWVSILIALDRLWMRRPN